jgi:hypothetical protein
VLGKDRSNAGGNDADGGNSQNVADGNAGSAAGSKSSANGGDANGAKGGNGGSAVVALAELGGATTSSNSATVTQVNKQAIVQVPVAVQKASAFWSQWASGAHH